MSLPIEAKQYYEIGMVKYSDNAKTILSLEDYSDIEKFSAIAESAYFLENGKLPEWAWIIEKAETLANGDSLFVHRDKDASL